VNRILLISALLLAASAAFGRDHVSPNGSPRSTVPTTAPSAGVPGGHLKASRLRKVLIVPTADGVVRPADVGGGQLKFAFFSPTSPFSFTGPGDRPNTFITVCPVATTGAR
jgi:hypothetical protein